MATVDSGAVVVPGADLTAVHTEFRDALAAAGLLVPMGLPGLYARGAVYEQVAAGVRHAVDVAAADVHLAAVGPPTVLRFPPVYPRDAFERTGYLTSFPQLAGVVANFDGDDAEHRRLLDDAASGRAWDHHLTVGDTALVSAACHPAYATLRGSTLPAPGRLLEVDGWCFRREPSPDPLRMQSFTMREYVRLGTPSQVREHLDAWSSRAPAVLAGLGLEVETAAANDPFFGRAGRLLARNQRVENLKTEVVTRLYGDLDDGTAVFSANLHLDHFGQPFAIATPDGQAAHSACVGFGVDRITLALLRVHGLRPERWTPEVRAALGPAPVSTGEGRG